MTAEKTVGLAALGRHLMSPDGTAIPNSVFGTDVSRAEIVSMADGTGQTLNVGHTDRSGRAQAFGNDVHSYIQALEDSLDATFNDGDFAQVMQEQVFPSEFRPFGTQPTPLNVQLLEDRSVVFNPEGKLDRSGLPTGTAISGSSVMVDRESPTGLVWAINNHDKPWLVSFKEAGSVAGNLRDNRVNICGSRIETLRAVYMLQHGTAIGSVSPLDGKPLHFIRSKATGLVYHIDDKSYKERVYGGQRGRRKVS